MFDKMWEEAYINAPLGKRELEILEETQKEKMPKKFKMDMSTRNLVPWEWTREYNSIWTENPSSKQIESEIKKVIFNPPATIVLWKNGDKTIAKTCKGDLFDPEIGLMTCIFKHEVGIKQSRLKKLAQKYNTSAEQSELKQPTPKKNVKKITPKHIMEE